MDAAVAGTLIGTAGSLFGAVLGGLISYISTSRMYTKQNQKDRRDARQTQEREAMKQCEALCVSMADDVENMPHPANMKHDNEEDQREIRIDESYRQLQVWSLYLPTSARTRVEELADVLSEATDMAYGVHTYGPTHYHFHRTIAWNAQKEIRRLAAAMLKDDPVPTSTHIIAEHVAALRHLRRDRDEIYSRHDEESSRRKQLERERDAFYQRHPELARDAET